MKNDDVKYGVRLHLVSEDIGLSQRLNLFIHYHTRWRITYSMHFRLPTHATLLIVPAHTLVEFRRHYSPNYLDIPVVAFGDSAYSTICFLSGCDDFLKSPWTFEELFCRVQRLVVPSTFTIPRLHLRVSPTRIQCGDCSIYLSFLEYRLLALLMHNIGEPVSRSVIFRRLFDENSVSSRTVDVYISKIRRKLREIMPYHLAITTIRTIHGFGYALVT